MCPVLSFPFGPPSRSTRWSRAALPLALGQGWPTLHVSSISRAAIPASRIFGPSAHQIGPSPSQTAVGVQVNDDPVVTAASAANAIMRDHSRLFAAGLIQRPVLHPSLADLMIARVRLPAPYRGLGARPMGVIRIPPHHCPDPNVDRTQGLLDEQAQPRPPLLPHSCDTLSRNSG